MRKLRFNKHIVNIMKSLRESLKKEGFRVNFDYFNYHNDICPRCQAKLKVFNGLVRGIQSVNVYIINDGHIAIPYGCCRNCSRELASDEVNVEKVEITEDFIDSKVY
jgi:hypothetical protein